MRSVMSKAIFWFRNDLRIADNPGLFQAYKQHSEVFCVYILDKPLANITRTAQSWWLHQSLTTLKKTININMFVGDAEEVLLELCRKHDITAVYWNRCYEPLHIARDTHIKQQLHKINVQAKSANGSLLNEPWEVLNKQGEFFKVFTPYWKQCLQQIVCPAPFIINDYSKFAKLPSLCLEELNLLPTWQQQFTNYWQPGEAGAEQKLQDFLAYKLEHYKEGRNYPASNFTSNLSPHLHFGELSPWHIFRTVREFQINYPAQEANTMHFLSELGWREFSYYLLYHFPKLTSANFKAQFDNFPWHDNDEAFTRWKRGKTGFPIIDAGMRELWVTGTMHNRVRMIVASFLVKDLFIDWRRGAQWFDETLLDADMASNYASWQWVAGSGADAAPYFRIFNPILQGEKFDSQGDYVKKWVPEVAHLPNKFIHKPWEAPTKPLNYYEPMVNHDIARKKALSYYQALRMS